MRIIHRHHHTTRLVTSGLLVLLGVLGAACTDEEIEPGLLVIDRDSFDFGQIMVGQTSPERVFTLRNAGPDTLDGLDVSLVSTSGFTLVGTTCVGWLEPSETCTVTVVFTPARAGAVEIDLVVEADRADARAALAGTGAVLVRLTNAAASSPMVVSEPAGIRCGSECEAVFTVPEIVLSVPDGGFATWSGPCETMAGGPCLLHLEGETSVELLDHASAVQWIFNGTGLLNRLVIDAQNNVIGAGGGTPYLFKLSPAGEVLWQIDELGPGIAADIDSQGDIAVASFSSVWKIDRSGAAEWGPELASQVTEVRDIAFDPAGNLYLTGVQRFDTGALVQLVKYDGNGNSLWSRSYDPATLNEVMALTVDGDGNVIITGFGYPDPPEGATSVQFLRKYDGDGNVVWTNENIGIHGYELAVDTAGNIFVADRIGGGSPGWYSLQKYTPDGALLWDTHAEDIGGLVSGLAVTAAGDVIAVGSRFDEDGAVGVWAAKFDGVDGTRRRPVEIQLQGDRQFARDVAVDRNGDVLLAGGEDEPWLRKYDGAVFDQLAE